MSFDRTQRCNSTDLTKRERRWLSLIARHGPLSSEVLFEATRHSHRCKDTSLRALQRLRSEGWLFLPKQQAKIAKAEFNPYVYDLSPNVQCAVIPPGRPTLRPTGHWWHAFTTSTLTAAIEIEANRRGLGYIPAAEIGKVARNGLAMETSLGRVIPDQLFALKYPAGFRLIALEVDRSTEPVSSPAHRKSLNRSIKQYAEICVRSLHRHTYDVASPLLVVWSVRSKARQRALLKAATDLPGSTSLQFAIGDLPRQASRYEAYAQVVQDDWIRAEASPLRLLEGGTG